MTGRLWRLAAIWLSATAAVSTDADQKPITEDEARGGSTAGGSPFTKEFAELARARMEAFKVPGVALAVIDDNEVYAEGFGIATFPDTPATPETLWYGASTSKAYVAATIAHLIDTKAYPELSQGWQTPISSIIRDDFVLPDEWATRHVTLDDAASHRTGMPRHDLSSAREIGGKPVSTGDIVRNLRNLPLREEPRVKWQYCNLMYVTLSYVVEYLTGEWLGDVLRRTIWDPLGMNSTYFDLDTALNAPEHFAQGYVWLAEEQEYAAVPYMSVAEVSGAGSVISNVLDYAEWVRCLLHEGAPFSAAAHRDIRAPRMISTTEAGGGFDAQLYGLAWDRTLYEGEVVYTHSGGMHAYGAQVYWLPERRFGVVGFGNTAMTSNAVEEVLAFQLIADKLALPEEGRFNFTAKWDDAIADIVKNSKDPKGQLFPHIPEQPLPPTLNISDFTGRYYNAGYDGFTLRVDNSNPDAPEETILVGDCTHMTWKYSWWFHHVSGDYWMAQAHVDGNPGMEQFMRAEFKVGPDGRAAGVVITMQSPSDPVSDGDILYEKVE